MTFYIAINCYHASIATALRNSRNLLAMRTQLNVRVPKSVRRRVISDRKKSATTNDVVVEVALENLFTKYTPDQRATFYRSHHRKPYARCA